MTKLNKMVHVLGCLVVIMVAVGSGPTIWASTTPPDSRLWTSLFNGQDFTGWMVMGGDGTYKVVDGAIVGVNGHNDWLPNTFLCTDTTYGDFELEVDVMLSDPLNSGIQLRSKVRIEDKRDGGVMERVYGPQVEIAISPGKAGYIYGEGYARWFTPESEVIPHSQFRNGVWNRYRILAVGARIQVWLNGHLVSDLVDEESFRLHQEGFIGLQVHFTKSIKAGTVSVAWKNINIRRIQQ